MLLHSILPKLPLLRKMTGKGWKVRIKTKQIPSLPCCCKQTNNFPKPKELVS